MEYIFIICICVLTMIILKFAWSIKIRDIKKLKELGYDKGLNEITNKLPENKEICKDILKMLNNENVKIEESESNQASLYMVLSNIHIKPSLILDDNSHYLSTTYAAIYPANKVKNHLKRVIKEQLL